MIPQSPSGHLGSPSSLLAAVSGGRIPNLLDTLAAAQAATGDFESAAATTRTALALLQTP